MIKCFVKAVSAQARMKPNVLFKNNLLSKKINIAVIDKRQILALLIKESIRDNGCKFKLNITYIKVLLLSRVFIVLFH